MAKSLGRVHTRAHLGVEVFVVHRADDGVRVEGQSAPGMGGRRFYLGAQVPPNGHGPKWEEGPG